MSYYVGQKIYLDEAIYIIARLDKNLVGIINIKNGNRWNKPIKVKDDKNITDKEMSKLVNNRAIKIQPIPRFLNM